MEALDIGPEQLLRFSLDDYHRLIDLGFFDEDLRAEFLEGYLLTMSPQSPLHARIIRYLAKTLMMAASGSQEVLVQMPLTLARSEPEPDVAVVDARHLGGPRHPTSALLVIEVSGEDSLRRDSVTKTVLYAEAGVAEYWVIDTAHERVIVHRDPDPVARVYRVQHLAGTKDLLQPGALPSVEVSVAHLFSLAQ